MIMESLRSWQLGTTYGRYGHDRNDSDRNHAIIICSHDSQNRHGHATDQKNDFTNRGEMHLVYFYEQVAYSVKETIYHLTDSFEENLHFFSLVEAAG